MSKFMHYLYIFFVSVLALALFFVVLKISDYEMNWSELLFWAILAVISETFHIILPSNAATSVGMAVYLAALVTSGPLIAITIPILAFLFRVPEVNGERRYLFTYNPSIVIYNVTSHVVIIGTTSIIYYLVLGNTNIVDTITIIVSLMLLTLSELISIVLISVYFYTRNGRSEIPLFKSFISALPSTWAVGALGLFLAFAAAEYGMGIVGLFFVPLLLSRYSFKLYFDSQKMGLETIQALNAALLVRDLYTASHTERVEEYSLMLGRALNYSPSALDRLAKAAKLHDIGKIGIPDGILNKPGKLTESEYEQIKDHASMGAQILGNVDAFKKMAEIIRHHHERPDGKGYPDGLSNDEIPRDSAILAIADSYDAMTSDRPYREGLSKDYAVSELIRCKGTQFKPYLVEVFVDNIDAHEATKEAMSLEPSISTENNLNIIEEEETNNNAVEVSA